MTRIFQTNSNNDIFTSPGGRLALSVDRAAVLQQCQQAVQAQTQEMIYAANRGVNTFDSVWSGSPNLLSFEASARAQLDRIPDVVAVEDFTAQLDGHTISYQSTIRTVFGTGLVDGFIGGVARG